MKRSVKKTASIEFFVDETADLLLAYEHPPQGRGEADSEEVLSLPLSNVRVREPAEMQRTLGRLVLSFLNSRSSKGLNLPRDLEDEKKLDEEHLGKLQATADGKTPEAHSLHHADHVARHCALRIRRVIRCRGGLAARPIAAKIGADDREVLGKGGRNAVPHQVRFGKAMQEQQRLPAALAADEDRRLPRID